MNKIFKYFITTLICFGTFFTYVKGAENIGAAVPTTYNSPHTFEQSDNSISCAIQNNGNHNCSISPGVVGNGDTTMYNSALYCFYGNFTINCNQPYTIYSDFITPTMSSLSCQTEYNLIPISEVTTNYCAVNFGMITPQECPINSGTGAIVWSNLMINDIPYAQNQNINVFIPDFLAWNISFNDLYTVIEIEGYDADEEYINSIINNEKLTPTNEDFAYLLTGLVNFVPYLFIGLLILRAVRILSKIWK